MKAINIDWDTDGEKVDLPTEVEIPHSIEVESLENEDDQAITDYLSDEYGWCVNGYDLTTD